MDEVAATLPPDKWIFFAIQLGLSYKCIKDTEYEHKGNVALCLIDVFHKWQIQQTSPYTWETVVKALRSPSVNATVLADTISTKFLTAEK